MLSEGRGLFTDFSAYRKRLTDIVWLGIMPEETPEEMVASAEELIGQPVPEDRLQEARELMERMKAAAAVTSEVASDRGE